MKNFVLKKIKVLIGMSLIIGLYGCETAKPSSTQKHNYVEPPFVDYTLTDLPEFVDEISKCLDTSKQYVLPDGYLYGYETALTSKTTDQIAISTDLDGSVFNGTGYQDNARIRSVLEIGESDYSFITGFIPVKPGDVIYFNGKCANVQYEKAGSMNTVFYNSTKEVISYVSMINYNDENYFESLETDDNGYITSMRISNSFSDELSYIRFSLIGSCFQKSISVNEEPEFTEEYTLRQIEKYIAKDWIKEIVATTEAINSLELLDNSTAVKFVLSSDIHLDPYLTTSYVENLGKVAAQVMKDCKIPFYIDAGDICTQSTGFMPSDYKRNIKDALACLEPIPHKNIISAVGNHDGATGARVVNGETLYYRFQLSNEERSSVFFDWQRESNEQKTFNSDGTYYYLDDSSTKTRYIVLNSFWSKWEGSEDGFVEDEQQSFFSSHIFGPEQLRWFAEEALDMPLEYGAVIIAHHVRPALDFEMFKGIVDAFSGKTFFEGSYEGERDWQSSEISVNFEDAYGEIIAVFQGHNHLNTQYDYFNDIPCINITTSGAYWDVRDEDAIERVKGTSSEFAVDVVVIDREARIIYCTRLGAGEDRVIEY